MGLQKMVTERFTSEMNVKHSTRRYKLAAGANEDRDKFRLEWVEAREANAPTVIAETKNMVESSRLPHFYASSFTSTEPGTEAHSIVGSTPGGMGLEACRGLAQWFDPGSARINLNLMTQILNPNEAI